MYPQLMFRAKLRKIIKKNHLKINIFYDREILLYITWACLRNDYLFETHSFDKMYPQTELHENKS